MPDLLKPFPIALTEAAKRLLTSARDHEPLSVESEWGDRGVLYQGSRLHVEGEYERAQIRLSIYEVLGRTGLNLPNAMGFGINVYAQATSRTSSIQGDLWAYQAPKGPSTSFNGTMGLYDASRELIDRELARLNRAPTVTLERVPPDGFLRGLLKQAVYLRP